MLKTNKENLVKWSVQGKIHHPLGGNYRIACRSATPHIKIRDSIHG